MRRTLKIGFTFAVLVGMSGLMAFADGTVYTGNAPMGPRYGRHMVKKNDMVNSYKKYEGPTVPNKPHPVVESRSVGRGGTLGNTKLSSGGAIPVASASPQVVLEARLKSLANDLR